MKFGILGHFVFFQGPNLWRILWGVRGYKHCSEISLKYEGVVQDIVVSTSTYGGLVTDYSTNNCPTSYFTSTYIESISAYGVNVTGLSTDIHSYYQVSTGLDPMGDSNFSTKCHFSYTERTSYYGGIFLIVVRRYFILMYSMQATWHYLVLHIHLHLTGSSPRCTLFNTHAIILINRRWSNN